MHAAPLWDRETKRIVGMLTVTDFIYILTRYYKMHDVCTLTSSLTAHSSQRAHIPLTPLYYSLYSLLLSYSFPLCVVCCAVHYVNFTFTLNYFLTVFHSFLFPLLQSHTTSTSLLYYNYIWSLSLYTPFIPPFLHLLIQCQSATFFVFLSHFNVSQQLKDMCDFTFGIIVYFQVHVYCIAFQHPKQLILKFSEFQISELLCLNNRKCVFAMHFICLSCLTNEKFSMIKIY